MVDAGTISGGTSLPQLAAQFGAERIELRVVSGAHRCIVGARVEHAEQEESELPW